MTNLEQQHDAVDFHSQVESDLSRIDPNSSLNAAELALLKGEREKVEAELKTMEASKNVVDSVLNRVESLVQLESKLREPSEYRDSLLGNKWVLSGYSEEMWKKIASLTAKVEDTDLKESTLDVRSAKAYTQLFEWYAEEAKTIEATLKEMEREIKNLVRDQETNDRIDNYEQWQEDLASRLEAMQRENERLRKENQGLIEANEGLMDEVQTAETQVAEAQQRADAAETRAKRAETRARTAEWQVKRIFESGVAVGGGAWVAPGEVPMGGQGAPTTSVETSGEGSAIGPVTEGPVARSDNYRNRRYPQK